MKSGSRAYPTRQAAWPAQLREPCSRPPQRRGSAGTRSHRRFSGADGGCAYRRCGRAPRNRSAPSSTVAVGHVVVGRVLRTGATRQRQHHSQTRYDKDRRPPMCRNGRSFGMLKCRTGILPCIPAVARAVPFRFGEELGAIGAPTIVLLGDDVRHAALYFRFSRGLAESGKVR